MGHPAGADELFELPSDELGPIIRGDPRRNVGKQLPRPLQETLDFGFGHRFAYLQVHQIAAVAVQHAAQVVERGGNIEVANFQVPVLVRPKRLLEVLALARGSVFSAEQPSRQHTPDTGWTDRDDVGIEHNKR